MENLWLQLLEAFKTNEIFSGVALGSMLTSMFVGFVYSLKRIPGFLLYLIKRFMTVRLEINNDDSEYNNFLVWAARFNNQNLRSYNFNSIKNNTSLFRTLNEVSSQHTLSFGNGSHFIWYHGRPIYITKVQHYENAEGIKEMVTISTIGITSKFIERLYKEIVDIANNTDSLKLFITEENRYWEDSFRNKKNLDYFVFKRKHEILKNLRMFFSKKEWYLERGLTHKKGILLSGPPGTGKSTFASIIASELNLNLYYLNLSNPDTINVLDSLISDVKENSVILLEDIDCLFMTKSRESIETNDSLSTLLNVLDGVTSPSGVVYILTTNYIDRIDKAIIRPGRIDMNIEMNYFDYDDLYEMMCNYYDIEHFNDFYKVFNKIDWKNLSPASLQNMFIHFPEPQDLVNEIENNFDNFKQDYLR